MSRDRKSWIHVGRAPSALALALLLAALPYPAGAQEGNPDAQAHLDNAISALGGNQPNPQEALDEVDKVLDIEPGNAQAYFYRGMAYGQMQRLQEALDAFLTAADLSPGYTDAHVWACRLAFGFENWELAWDQGILASQSGFDMSQAFAELRQLADEPDDFQKRLRVPRILLGGVDVEAITGQDSFLTDVASIGDAAGAGSRGASAAPGGDRRTPRSMRAPPALRASPKRKPTSSTCAALSACCCRSRTTSPSCNAPSWPPTY